MNDHYQTKTTNSLLGFLAILIVSKNYLHHFAQNNDLMSSDGLVNLFISTRFLSSKQDARITVLDIISKKFVKKLIAHDYDTVTIESVKKFLCNPNVKRSIRDQKLLFKKKDQKYMPWKSFFESIGVFFDRIDDYLVNYKHKLI